MAKLLTITTLTAALAASIDANKSALDELQESSADLAKVQDHLQRASQIPDEDDKAPKDMTQDERVYAADQHAAALRIAQRGVEAALKRQDAAVVQVRDSGDKMRAALAQAAQQELPPQNPAVELPPQQGPAIEPPQQPAPDASGAQPAPVEPPPAGEPVT